ncbi:MAG: hypothetical protein M9894_34210 [Planctomycetes bacterium]|nr:hypothetical protein [Planctomycetota bacterium]
MIVYGDRRAREDPRALARTLLDDCHAASRLGADEGQDARRRVLIAAGELAQGLVDHAFAARGEVDEAGPLERLASRLTTAAARALVAGGAPADVAAVVHEVLRAPLPGEVEVRVPEGYACYALLPEAYAAAIGRAGRGPCVVVGLRSIGTGLAAVVAAAGDAVAPPVSLRPVGHPFARTVRPGPALARWLLDAPAAARFVIVDEGPGLSGSSLNGAADWLEDHGVAPERLLFVPHHGGDLGPQASARHRERWARAARVAAEAPRDFGLGLGAFEDVGGGRWRARLYPDERAWPAVDVRQERVKLLVRGAGGARLYKFAGLGAYGDAALARARALADAGLAPPALGLERGFLVHPWLDGARPLDALGRATLDRRDLVARVGAYLTAVARGLPRAPRAGGASPATLLDMARHNAGAALGEDAAAALERWRERLPRLAADLRAVATDARMQAFEWLVAPGGRLLKADGVDHHAGHDLIGCQDVAWDVAGAAVELGLDPDERARLGRAVGRKDEVVLDFHENCYLAFQVGRCWLAARAAAPDEAARLEAAGRGYAARLARRLGAAAA